MKTLLLVYPNQKWKKIDFATNWIQNPITLCQLAAVVKKYINVKIIDAHLYDLSKSDFIEKVKNINPDYVGISVLTTEYGETLPITASLVKSVNSKITVIAGGVHVRLEYKEIVNDENIDFIVHGEGERVLLELIKYLDNKGDFPSKGLVYRDENNNPVFQEPDFIEDLDDLPWPDYSLVNLEDYLNKIARKGPLSAPELPCYRITISRGCPFECSFCQIHLISGKKVRTRNPGSVIEHLMYMKEKYKIRSFIIDDDNIIGAKGFFKEFLNLAIENKINLPFTMSGTAAFLLNDELLDLMVEAKCVGVNIAIESGNKRVNKEIVNKPVDLDTLPDIIKKITDRGITCMGNFIIGLPGESWDEIMDTIRYAETCGVDYVKIFIAIPLKNTKLWDLAVKYDSFIGHDDVSMGWRFGQLEGKDWTAKDVTILRAYEWDRINFGSEEKLKKMEKIWKLSKEELNEIRKQTRDAIHL